MDWLLKVCIFEALEHWHSARRVRSLSPNPRGGWNWSWQLGSL